MHTPIRALDRKKKAFFCFDLLKSFSTKPDVELKIRE